VKIAIYGTGGVGGLFGGLLALEGHDVHFIARGAHLEAMRRNGLQVHSDYGDFDIQPVVATDSPNEIGEVDYVILAVKHFQLHDMLPGLIPLIGSETTVVPLLNGVDAHEHIIPAVGHHHVIGGTCSVVSMIEAPGVIRQVGKLRRIILGELDRVRSERVERIVQAWVAQSVDASQTKDIFAALWNKFLFIASLGGVGSLTQATAGEIRVNPETKRLLGNAMHEVEHLAQQLSIDIPPDAVHTAMLLVESMDPSTTSSMQRDVEAGKPFELEAFSGTIVRLGRQASIDTPVHESIYALLLPALSRAFQGINK
jgi:2-dehydropantoate 2-reductase